MMENQYEAFVTEEIKLDKEQYEGFNFDEIEHEVEKTMFMHTGLLEFPADYTSLDLLNKPTILTLDLPVFIHKQNKKLALPDSIPLDTENKDFQKTNDEIFIGNFNDILDEMKQKNPDLATIIQSDNYLNLKGISNIQRAYTTFEIDTQGDSEYISEVDVDFTFPSLEVSKQINDYEKSIYCFGKDYLRNSQNNLKYLEDLVSIKNPLEEAEVKTKILNFFSAYELPYNFEIYGYITFVMSTYKNEVNISYVGFSEDDKYAKKYTNTLNVPELEDGNTFIDLLQSKYSDMNSHLISDLVNLKSLLNTLVSEGIL